MVDVKMKRCLYDSCMKSPSYNFDGMTEAYCKPHAEDGMVNVRHKRCFSGSCRMLPIYNFEGSKPAVFCKQHAKGGMVDVWNKSCLHDSCTKRPGYNFKGTKAAYCRQHADDGMVDVRSKHCSHESCTKIASFSFEGRKQAYCKQYAEDGVVNVRWKRSKRSPNDSFTAIGASPLTSTDGAPTVTVLIEALCETAHCLKQSRCGMDGKQLTRCLEHAPLEGGVANPKAVVDMALTKRGSRSSSSLDSKTHFDDNGDVDGTAAKRTRHRLDSRFVTFVVEGHPPGDGVSNG
ncbi:unnamed protein product [Laminaria digitata]